jgi:hypothetical protein
MIRVRELSAEEQQMIERLAHSRTAEARWGNGRALSGRHIRA